MTAKPLILSGMIFGGLCLFAQETPAYTNAAVLPLASQLLEDGYDQMVFTDDLQRSLYTPPGELLGHITRIVVPRKAAKPWASAVYTILSEGIRTNQIYALAFMVRALATDDKSGEGLLIAHVGNEDDFNDRVLSAPVPFAKQWEPVYFIFRTTKNFPQARLQLDLATRGQTLEIKGLVVARFTGEPSIDDVAPGKFAVEDFIKQVRGR